MKSTRIAFLALSVCAVLLCGGEAKIIDRPCPRVCPRHIDPVCGIRGDERHEFTNRCNWQAYNCENIADGYPDMVDGECEQ